MELDRLRILILALVTIFPWSVAAATAPAACLQQSVALEQSSALLRALTAVPTPPFVPLLSQGEARFVATTGLFAELIKVPPGAYIVNDIEELRFIAHTLTETPILLVLKSAPDWTPEKSRKVVSVAKILKLSISLVWVDDSQIPTQLVSTLEDLNGKIIRLNELTRLIFERYCALP